MIIKLFENGLIETIDQEQSQSGYNFVVYGNRWSAQSTIPSLDTVTKIELYVKKGGSPSSDVIVSIRDALSGSDLTSVSHPSSSIGTSYGWIEFNLSDNSVVPGVTYNIVLCTSNGSFSDSYSWSLGYNTPYTDGNLWYSCNSGTSWIPYNWYDFCFKTYGYS